MLNWTKPFRLFRFAPPKARGKYALLKTRPQLSLRHDLHPGTLAADFSSPNALQSPLWHETANHDFQCRPRPQSPRNTSEHSEQVFPRASEAWPRPTAQCRAPGSRANLGRAIDELGARLSGRCGDTSSGSLPRDCAAKVPYFGGCGSLSVRNGAAGRPAEL